jgi:hypothetical protein
LTEQKFLAIGSSVEQATGILALLASTFEGLHAELQSSAVARVGQTAGAPGIAAGAKVASRVAPP